MATRLWGREHELAIVHARLTDALGGHPSVVVLSGEPGIGKSSLLRELMATATEAGTEVLWGRGIVTGNAPPFSLWQQITSVPTPIEADRFAAYEAVRNAVLAHVPGLVVIDDLQWADASRVPAVRCRDLDLAGGVQRQAGLDAKDQLALDSDARPRHAEVAKVT
ncbi:MAG: hypothetical protein DLM58_24685, partial [Pseudonocardiales bacterium]